MSEMNVMENSRELRGLDIAKAKESQISRIDSSTYRVFSQSGNGEYVVYLSEDEWKCECPDRGNFKLYLLSFIQYQEV